jgi:hypothetical protein
MQWGGTETSPRLGVISFKIIVVLGRDMPALSAVSAVKILSSVICGIVRAVLGD